MGIREFFEDGSVVKGAASWIIGNSFTRVIFFFTTSFVIPIFGIFGGIPEFKDSHFTINSSRFYFGEFLDAVIAFLIVGLVLYICIILPFDIISKKLQESKVTETRECPMCFSEISKKASKCPHCISDIEPMRTATEDDKDEKGGKFSLRKCYSFLDPVKDNQSESSAPCGRFSKPGCSERKLRLRLRRCPCCKKLSKDRGLKRGSHYNSVTVGETDKNCHFPNLEKEGSSVDNVDESLEAGLNESPDDSIV